MLDEEVDDAVSRVAGVLKEAGAKRVFSFCPSTQTPFSDNIPTLTNPANSSHQKHHIEEAVIQSEKNVQNIESVEGLIESTKSSPSDNNTSMVMEIQSSDNATLSLAEEKKNKNQLEVVGVGTHGSPSPSHDLRPEAEVWVGLQWGLHVSISVGTGEASEHIN